MTVSQGFPNARNLMKQKSTEVQMQEHGIES